MDSNCWYLKKESNTVTVWTEERQLKIKTSQNTRREIIPGPVASLESPQSLSKTELKKVYGNRKPKENEICVFFKSGAAVILDFEKYDRTSRINKLNAITKESLITEFKNSSEPTNRQDKRKQQDSPPLPRKRQNWSVKTETHNIIMAENVQKKRVTISGKDVFQIPVSLITFSEQYSMREISKDFVKSVKHSLERGMAEQSTIIYLVCEESPLQENGDINVSENQFHVLGGTHLLSALKDDTSVDKKVLAAVFHNLTEEEMVWLAANHNNQQHLVRKLTAKDYITNFRRLLFANNPDNADDEEPPIKPPSDWRLQCQGLLPLGKNINSYSPWLAMAKCSKSTWERLCRFFQLHEQGKIKGITKAGQPITSFRLWREMANLPEEERNKVLTLLINKKLTISEAIEDSKNRYELSKIRKLITDQLNMASWEDVVEKYGQRVNSEVLLPFTRLGNLEAIPALFGEFLYTLKGELEQPSTSQSVWKRGDLEIVMIKGTPLSPPKSLWNVVVTEMSINDESFGIDELKMIINRTKNNLQRQMHVILTAFSVFGDLRRLAEEMFLQIDYAVVDKKIEKTTNRSQDRTLPTGVIPVVILYKTSPAAPQVYTSSSSRVSNHFNYIEDLLQTCIFVSDRVLDTSLNVEIARKINCTELTVIGSSSDIKVYKQNLMESDGGIDEIVLASSPEY